MDLVGNHHDEIAQKLGRDHLTRPFVQFDICKLRCAVDCHQEADFAFACADFSNIDVEVHNPIPLEPLLGLVAFDLGQSA